MAHFAHVNPSNNIVDFVIVADQDYINTLEHPEEWIQTSYNTVRGVHLLGGQPLRKNFAGGGFTYDPVRDAFIPPKPYNSWVLDEFMCDWVPPIPIPNETSRWDEDTVSWIEV